MSGGTSRSCKLRHRGARRLVQSSPALKAHFHLGSCSCSAPAATSAASPQGRSSTRHAHRFASGSPPLGTSPARSKASARSDCSASWGLPTMRLRGRCCTDSQRQRQREAIQRWRPWERSTGPKSQRGKAQVACNGWKGGTRAMSPTRCAGEQAYVAEAPRKLEILSTTDLSGAALKCDSATPLIASLASS